MQKKKEEEGTIAITVQTEKDNEEDAKSVSVSTTNIENLAEEEACIRLREDNSVKASTAIGVVGNEFALLRLVPGRIQSSFEATLV